MKIFNFLFALACLPILLASCSKEDITTNGNDEAAKNSYLSVSLTLPEAASGRSIDDSGVKDEGTANENTVTSILVVLFNPSGLYSDSKVFQAGECTKTNNTYATPEKGWLVAAGEKKLVAIVNPLQDDIDNVSTNFATITKMREVRTGYTSVAAFTTDNKFVMSNAADLGSKTPAENGYFEDGSVRVNLQPGIVNVAKVNVERTVAKVMEMSDATKINDGYNVIGTTGDKVFLEYLCPTNLNASYYPIKKVEKSGQDANDYIVDANFTIPTAITDWTTAEFLTYANAQFYSRDYRSSTNYKALAPSDYKGSNCNFSFYCFENTNTAAQQINALSTMVCYKATYVVAGATKGDNVYKFQGVAYTYDQIVALCGLNQTEYTNAKDSKDLNKYKAIGITKYVNGVCFYPYIIKHKDSSTKNDVMKYAVVRNNSYRLNVQTISGIGNDFPPVHPQEPGNPGGGNPDDPTNPEEPGTPGVDNDDIETYLQVEVTVLPWVVRANDIDF